MRDEAETAVGLRLTADTPEALEAAQRTQAAALEPWAPAILWLARAKRFMFLKDDVEYDESMEPDSRETVEALMDSAVGGWEEKGLAPLPEGSLARLYEGRWHRRVHGLIERLRASAIAALPDAAAGPLPVVSDSWRLVGVPDRDAICRRYNERPNPDYPPISRGPIHLRLDWIGTRRWRTSWHS
ncbi:hypothetical protein GCM10010245_91800 [Streptomyces spectabilis]|uniref:Uncharacterized protein n=1 Tax=Streptomyces spectabilis TaxID=68270 RepID=A0A7W8F0T8_STRST|nr:hypothetical protein [Streptomyces spectabilis]MBB5110110.1 hypothetical protein [Streptomyces spectabilis]GGV58665.1 hypothetical protein GCM10010245_91800 [Streptomyces spectabilis]